MNDFNVLAIVPLFTERVQMAKAGLRTALRGSIPIGPSQAVPRLPIAEKARPRPALRPCLGQVLPQALAQNPVPARFKPGPGKVRGRRKADQARVREG